MSSILQIINIRNILIYMAGLISGLYLSKFFGFNLEPRKQIESGPISGEDSNRFIYLISQIIDTIIE
jgi:hypothetical protein